LRFSFDLDEFQTNDDFISVDIKNTSQVPWLHFKGVPYSSHPSLALHTEIIDFFEFCKETKEEKKLRQEVIARVKKLIYSCDRNAKIDLFGSYATNLMLPGWIFFI